MVGILLLLLTCVIAWYFNTLTAFFSKVYHRLFMRR